MPKSRVSSRDIDKRDPVNAVSTVNFFARAYGLGIDQHKIRPHTTSCLVRKLENTSCFVSAISLFGLRMTRILYSRRGCLSHGSVKCFHRDSVEKNRHAKSTFVAVVRNGEILGSLPGIS